jgi:putative ABC transport system substrate-binding protein
LGRHGDDVRSSRRAFVNGIVFVLLAPVAVEAQQPAQQGTRVPRVGVVLSNAPFTKDSWFGRAFLEGFREHGWIDGQNITIEWRAAEGQPERIPALVRGLVGLPVDVIMTTSVTAALEATRASHAIPVVMAGGSFDQLKAAGLVQSLVKPGRDVTGMMGGVDDDRIGSKYLQLLKETAPRISRVGYLFSPPLTARPPANEAAADSLNLKLVPVEVTTPEGLEKAFEKIRTARVDAIWVGSFGFSVAQRGRIIQFAARERLPAIYWWRGFSESGGLISYGVDWVEVYRRAPAYVNKILKGARPGDLPLEQPRKFELVINMKTAKALGLTIPPSVLTQADQVIE